MKIDSQKRTGGSIVVTLELDNKELEQLQNQAAVKVSTSHNISGFRPGKAPYDLIKKQLGETSLQEEVLLLAVKKYYVPFVIKEKLEVVDKPQVKAADTEPFIIQITATLLPQVTLGNWQKVRIKPEPENIPAGKADKVIEDLRESRASEVLVSKPSSKGDRVEIDFQVSVDNVAIEGGQATGYSVIIGKGQLVPGFEENIIGLKAGESKKFDLQFPKDYHKNLAGKKAQVNTKVKSVYSRTLPEANDDFAKNLGKFASLSDLRGKIEKNLQDEARQMSAAQAERKMLDEILQQVSFTDIPELLVTNEVEVMLREFTHGIANKGLVFADYLKSIHKTIDDLKKEFKESGLKRVKIALIIRQLGKENKLAVSDEAVEEELSKLLEHFAGQTDVMAKLDTTDYRDHLKGVLSNQQVVKWLKDQLIIKITD
ncbi:MAG: trigger factor [Patescibacteria group bacterium]